MNTTILPCRVRQIEGLPQISGEALLIARERAWSRRKAKSRNEERETRRRSEAFTHGVQREWEMLLREKRCPINYFTGSRAHKSER